MYQVLGILLVSIFTGCSPYKFQPQGHFIEGVDEYFNLSAKRNIWVYMDFVAPVGEAYGVRTDRFYPEDRAVLDHVGLNGRDMRTLFSAVPSSRSRYHLVVLAHKNSKFSYVGYEEVVNKASRYFKKDYAFASLDIRHVVIPYGKKKMLSMVYYIEKNSNQNNSFAGLHYLADINAQELQEGRPFKDSWQVFDCDVDSLTAHTIQIDRELLKKHKLVYLTLDAVYERETGINYAKILTRKNRGDIKLKLCPNRYQLEYRKPDGSLIGRAAFGIE